MPLVTMPLVTLPPVAMPLVTMPRGGAYQEGQPRQGKLQLLPPCAPVLPHSQRRNPYQG